LRKSSHPNPTIKFFDVTRLLRSIDDADSDVKNDSNYDESDSESQAEDDNASEVTEKLPTFTPSAYLPDDNDDIDLASAELEETLADKPLPKKRKVAAMTAMDEAGSEQEDEGKSFELASWV
jgi:hypothetical protein